jgi:hypothetical protein
MLKADPGRSRWFNIVYGPIEKGLVALDSGYEKFFAMGAEK